MGVVLQLARGGAAALAVAGLGKGLDFSTDGNNHEVITYVAFYGAGTLFAVLVAILTVAIRNRNARGAMPAGSKDTGRREVDIDIRTSPGAIGAGRDVIVGDPARPPGNPDPGEDEGGS